MGAGKNNGQNYGGEHTGCGKKRRAGPYSTGARIKEESNEDFKVGVEVTYNGGKKFHVKDGFNRIERGKQGKITGYDGRERRLVQFDKGYGSPVTISIHRDALTLGQKLDVPIYQSKQSDRRQGTKMSKSLEQGNKTQERLRKRETRKKLREIRSNIAHHDKMKISEELNKLCGNKSVIGFLRETGVYNDKNMTKNREKASRLHSSLINNRYVSGVSSGYALGEYTKKEAVRQGIEVFTDIEIYKMNETLVKALGGIPDNVSHEYSRFFYRQKEIEEEVEQNPKVIMFTNALRSVEASHDNHQITEATEELAREKRAAVIEAMEHQEAMAKDRAQEYMKIRKEFLEEQKEDMLDMVTIKQKQRIFA